MKILSLSIIAAMSFIATSANAQIVQHFQNNSINDHSKEIIVADNMQYGNQRVIHRQVAKPKAVVVRRQVVHRPTVVSRANVVRRPQAVHHAQVVHHTNVHPRSVPVKHNVRVIKNIHHTQPVYKHKIRKHRVRVLHKKTEPNLVRYN